MMRFLVKGWVEVGSLQEHTAIDEVIMKAPPSGFALKVGMAARRRARGPLTFTAQHFPLVSDGVFVVGNKCVLPCPNRLRLGR